MEKLKNFHFPQNLVILGEMKFWFLVKCCCWYRTVRWWWRRRRRLLWASRELQRGKFRVPYRRTSSSSRAPVQMWKPTGVWEWEHGGNGCRRSENPTKDPAFGLDRFRQQRWQRELKMLQWWHCEDPMHVSTSLTLLLLFKSMILCHLRRFKRRQPQPQLLLSLQLLLFTFRINLKKYQHPAAAAQIMKKTTTNKRTTIRWRTST